MNAPNPTDYITTTHYPEIRTFSTEIKGVPLEILQNNEQPTDFYRTLVKHITQKANLEEEVDRITVQSDDERNIRGLGMAASEKYQETMTKHDNRLKWMHRGRETGFVVGAAPSFLLTYGQIQGPAATVGNAIRNFHEYFTPIGSMTELALSVGVPIAAGLVVGLLTGQLGKNIASLCTRPSKTADEVIHLHQELYVDGSKRMSFRPTQNSEL